MPSPARALPDFSNASSVVAAASAAVPVDLDRIADRLGVVVNYTAELPRGVSGRIYRSPGAPSGFAIDINSNEGASRQRFTLAHEIAHFVLHLDLIGDGVTDDALYRSALASDLESQANRYAADILLSPRAVRTEFSKDRSLGGLARRFRVSREALDIRLKQLGLVADL